MLEYEQFLKIHLNSSDLVVYIFNSLESHQMQSFHFFSFSQLLIFLGVTALGATTSCSSSLRALAKRALCIKIIAFHNLVYLKMIVSWNNTTEVVALPLSAQYRALGSESAALGGQL